MVTIMGRIDETLRNYRTGTVLHFSTDEQFVITPYKDYGYPGTLREWPYSSYPGTGYTLYADERIRRQTRGGTCTRIVRCS